MDQDNEKTMNGSITKKTNVVITAGRGGNGIRSLLLGASLLPGISVMGLIIIDDASSRNDENEDLESLCRKLGVPMTRLVDDSNLKKTINHINPICDYIVAYGVEDPKPDDGWKSRWGILAVKKNQTCSEISVDKENFPSNMGSSIRLDLLCIDSESKEKLVVMEEYLPLFPYDKGDTIPGKVYECESRLLLQGLEMAGNETLAAKSHSQLKLIIDPKCESIHSLIESDRPQRGYVTRLKSFIKLPVFFILTIVIGFRDAVLCRLGRKILSILYYHRITDQCRDGMTVSIDEFRRQMVFLKKYYNIISPSDLDRWLQDDIPRSERKAVMITFDDGYEDNALNALPILWENDLEALIFLSTAHIGTNLPFVHDTKAYPDLKFRNMTWNQVRYASDNGMTFGIHTQNHLNLGRSRFEDSVKEIESSIEDFEIKTGKKVSYMSYPFGGKSDITCRILAYIQKHPKIDYLFSAYGNKNISPVTEFDLKRVNIGANDRLLITFLFKVEGGFRTLLRPFESLVSR
jgi:peptidoglycan/xylan/chitin deacetylase (PgdA/CDA1 family)